MTPDSKKLLTSKETAAHRRCSIRTLDRERAEGRGCRYIKIGGRIFYRLGDVDDFLEQHLTGGARGSLP
jgi:hypothetical protein